MSKGWSVVAEDLRDRYADAVQAVLAEWAHTPGDEGQFVGRLVHAVMSVRDEELERLREAARIVTKNRWYERLAEAESLRERAETADRLLAAVRHLRDVYEVNARTADDVKTRNWFELFVEELDAVLDPSSLPPETPALPEEERRDHR